MCTCKTTVPVRCVNLYTWLGCVNLHCTAAYRLSYLCREAELAHLLLVEYIAVVVACAVLDLLLIGIDACTNLCWGGEVECCALYRRDSTVRY